MRFPVSSKMLIEYGESSSPLPPTFCCCCCLAFLNFSACLPHITALGASELPPPSEFSLPFYKNLWFVCAICSKGLRCEVLLLVLFPCDALIDHPFHKFISCFK